MEYFDLHCDTLYKATVNNSSFNDETNHISMNKAEHLTKWTQLFAVFVPDELKGQNATRFFIDAVKVYEKNKISNEKFDMQLAVENVSMLSGDLKNLSLLIDNKVRSVTLTWNGENELGSGAMCNNDIGLTPFGKEVVNKLEDCNIAVDVSHASDKLFYDVIKIAKKPFIATHSNSRAITNVKRNLTDEQFKIIRDMGGIVGINFYKGFLNENEDDASIDDVIRHTEHFLNLCGENTLAIGSDFDGADMPNDIRDLTSIPAIYQRFLSEFGVNITKKIFYNNANMYFTNFDII